MVRFFDRVLRVDAGGKYEALDVVLYLKREVLVEHWNGKFLVAQLTEAASQDTTRTVISSAG